MLLVDSLYINNSGGKVLLDYLVEELEKSNINVFYLFDERCKEDFDNIPNERKLFLKASLVKRHLFYKKNKHRFSKFFCFGNLGPTIRLKSPVFAYFHQRLFLDIPQNLPFKQRIALKIKTIIFRNLLKNTDHILLQTESIKREFLKKNGTYKPENIFVLPFYESFEYPEIEKEENSFIYVSGGAAHKNHKNLLEGFVKFFDKNNIGKLIVTIPQKFSEIYSEIEYLKELGYPIINLEFVDKNSLAQHYASAQYTVYPSLSESFGLGIIEAIEGGCNVIGANFDYLHAVCKPSLTFNPNSIEEIAHSLELAIRNQVPKTEQKVFNQIDDIIDLLET